MEQISLQDSLLLATTYGFDIELQKLMAEEKSLKVDDHSFAIQWEKRKEQNREVFFYIY